MSKSVWYRFFDRQIGARLNTNVPRLLVIAIAGLIGGLVVWAGYADIETVIRAEGRIVPIGRSQVVQHLEGGVVQEVVVREGSTVAHGDLLIKIGDELGSAGLNEKKSRITSLRAKIERLQAEASGKAKLSMPADIVGTEVARSEDSSFQARLSLLVQEQTVISQQIVQRQAEIVEQENRRVDLSKEAQLAQKKLDLVARLARENAASQLEVLEEQARVQRFKSQIRDTENVLPKLRSSIAEFQSRLLESKNRFRAEAQSELSTVKAELARLSEEITAGADRVKRSEVRAPISGIVNKVFSNVAAGGVIRPGEAVIELTPINERLVVEARIKPADRAELVPGLNSRVRLTAYDFGLYGAVPARVTEISPDTLADERGDRFYRIKLDLDLSSTVLQGKPILPGMIVSADVVTGKRTVLSMLLARVVQFSRNSFSELK